MARKNDSGKQEKEKKGPSTLEWTAAFVGALVALGMLVFIGLEALQPGSGAPPLLEAKPSAIVHSQGTHVLEVKVANRSGSTAAAVMLEGELAQGGSTVETSHATIDYVPGNSHREAALIFRRDPSRYRLQVRATGYAVP